MLHVPVIIALTVAQHGGHSLQPLVAALPVAAVVLSDMSVLSRTVRSAIAAVALVMCSAIIVHLTHGAIEAHFHFFVMIPIIALYEDWLPFGLAVGFVLLEHGVLGTAVPHYVYGSPQAQAAPWLYAGVHAGFFAAAAAGCVLTWNLQEVSRQTQAGLAEALTHRAWHDSLTGLQNRDWLLDECPGQLNGGEASRLAVIILDVDRFKDVNDTLGHDVGDQLLRELACRITRAVGPGDRVARLGGDEFAVLLTGDRAGGAVEIAHLLRERVTGERVGLTGVDVDLEVTVGVAVEADPREGVAPDTAARLRRLLRQAEVAMYAAKAQHVDVQIYDPAADRHTIDRLGLLTDLREALYDDQLALAYQPKIDLADGRVLGVEALLRWTHPTRGPVPPMDFIPSAEATSLITPLTHRVLGLALEQARAWVDAGTPMRVSVNVPPRVLCEGDFVGVVRGALAGHGVAPGLLCLELTETQLMTDVDAALGVIEDLGALGVELAIDDFGTGFSSLSYLRRLPVGELKIDKSFVEGLLVHRQDQILIKATVDLAHDLGMSVVAEGVEDDTTAAMLAELGCDLGQGYLYSQPLSGPDLTRWVAARATRLGVPSGARPPGR